MIEAAEASRDSLTDDDSGDFCEAEDTMMAGKCVSCVIAATLLVSLGAWAEEEKTLSEDISYATFGESSDRVKVVVSAVPAKIEEPKLFLPLEVAVGARGAGPEISFTFESFQLIDGQGNYAAASTPQELQKNLEIWMETQRVRGMRPITTGNYFSGFKQVASNFYPKTGGYGETNLAQNMAFQDVVFFPLPDSLEGVMTLVVMGKGMDNPVEVHFEVPEKHKKDKE